MDVRVAVVVFLVFAGVCGSDARNLMRFEDLGVEVTGRKVDVCALCEQYVTVALDYLQDEKIHTEVLEALHKTCSQMRNLADKCMTMVDEYATTFFSEVSSSQPEGVCKDAGLCTNAMVSSLPSKRNKCEACHQAIDELLVMLKDPDTQLGIIERLLKACNEVDVKYKSQCKKLVFEYGPMLMLDAGNFVEKLDICSTVHACTRDQTKAKEALSEGMIEMVTST